MNCTKHFDLSSPFTARCPSCVARFMICWVCRLYFSGLVSSALSLDECLIKINYGRFCVAPRMLCRLVWHRVWLRCNVKRCFYRTTIFLRKIAEFSLWWFGCSQLLEVWTVASVLQGGFCVITGCWGKLFGCFENTGRMETFSMPGESDLVESFMLGHVYLFLSSGMNDLRR